MNTYEMKNENNIALNENKFTFYDLSKYRNAIYGFTALWIALFHGVILPEITLKHRWFEATLEMGNVGVDMFFLLSGISLYFSWEKLSIKNMTNTLVFSYKRLVKVFISFLIVAGPAIIWITLIKEHDVRLFCNMISTVSYWNKTYKYINLWFVSGILVFYILYPIIYKIIFLNKKYTEIRLFVLLFLSIAAGMYLYISFPDIYKSYDLVIARLPIFIFGCYCGKLVKDHRKIPVALLILCVAIFLISYPVYVDFGVSGIIRRYCGSLCGFAICIILAFLFKHLHKIKVDIVFNKLGIISLELYMYTIIFRSFYYSSIYYNGEYWLKYLIIIFISIIVSFLVKPIEEFIIKKCNSLVEFRKLDMLE